MDELNLLIDREIRRAAAGNGLAVLTVIEVAELLEVQDLVAALLLDDATRSLSSFSGPLNPTGRQLR